MEKKSKYSKIKYSRERTIFISHYTIHTCVEHLPLNPFFLSQYQSYSFCVRREPSCYCKLMTGIRRQSKQWNMFYCCQWCYQKFVASSVPRPSLFYLRSKNYILMAVSHSFKIFQRTTVTRKCICYTLCDFTFTVEISEKKNCLQDKFIYFSMLINRQIRP